MARFAAVLFSVLAVIYIGFITFGLIAAWPWGLVGVIVLLGFMFLFGWIVKDRLANREDDYYSKNVEK